MKDGDRYSKFFFISIMIKRKHNQIEYIKGTDRSFLSNKDVVSNALLSSSTDFTMSLFSQISPVGDVFSMCHLSVRKIRVYVDPFFQGY